MVGCGYILIHSKSFRQCFGEVRGEPGVSIQDHFSWDAEPLVDVSQVEVGDAFSCDRGRTWEEDGCSRASVVDYGEYCVVWTVFWELGDEVHRYFFEWVRFYARCDVV